MGEQVRFHLSSKTGQLWIGCTVTTSTQIDLSSTETETVEAKTKHTAQIGIAEIPEDGELRTDLVATKKSAEFLVDADPDCVTFKLKVQHIEGNVYCISTCYFGGSLLKTYLLFPYIIHNALQLLITHPPGIS